MARLKETLPRFTAGTLKALHNKRSKWKMKPGRFCLWNSEIQDSTPVKLLMWRVPPPNISRLTHLQVIQCFKTECIFMSFSVFVCNSLCCCSPLGGQPGTTAGILLIVLFVVILTLGCVVYHRQRKSSVERT